jgi:hypothetical protein
VKEEISSGVKKRGVIRELIKTITTKVWREGGKYIV